MVQAVRQPALEEAGVGVEPGLAHRRRVEVGVDAGNEIHVIRSLPGLECLLEQRKVDGAGGAVDEGQPEEGKTHGRVVGQVLPDAQASSRRLRASATETASLFACVDNTSAFTLLSGAARTSWKAFVLAASASSAQHKRHRQTE